MEPSHCGRVAVARARTPATTPVQDLVRGVWAENPVFRQLLGLCPALAVTSTVANSLAMGVATLGVLVGSSVLVSIFKRAIPDAIRLSTYILIIATWVTVADMVMLAVVPEIEKALGAFVYLIVVNCIILGRQEAFASRQPVGRALLDAVGTGAGNLLALIAIGTIREVVGFGRFLGVEVFGPWYESWVVMSLPPGGFFAIGLILLAFGWRRSRREALAGRLARVPVGAAG